MRKSRNYLTFRPGFGIVDLEKIVAERDNSLAQYYVGHGLYVERALDREDLASVFIGPKGIGKSAVLQMVRLDQKSHGNLDRIVEVAPDDLAFNALVNVRERTPLLKNPGDNQWLFKTLWDYVLCVALLEKEHGDKDRIQKALLSLFGTKHEREQKQLLKAAIDDNGSKRSMTEKMLALVEEIEIQGGYAGATAAVRIKTKSDNADDKKNTDLTTLQLINNVAKALPNSLLHDYYILIDDLDLNWSGTDIQNAFLGSLFMSIRKLTWSPRIKCVVSLRKQIYREIDLPERDKFSDMVCEMRWSPKHVQEMIERRVSYALSVETHMVWNGLFPEGAFDLMYSNTGGTPREAIRLAVTCITLAYENGHSAIDESDLRSGIKSFSESRLDDLVSDYGRSLPRLRNVIRAFEGRRKEFDIKYLQEIALDLAAKEEKESDQTNSWISLGYENPVEFGKHLSRCGFLFVKEGRDAEARCINHDEIESIDNKKWFAINPMYQSGLQLEGTRV